MNIGRELQERAREHASFRVCACCRTSARDALSSNVWVIERRKDMESNLASIKQKKTRKRLEA